MAPCVHYPAVHVMDCGQRCECVTGVRLPVLSPFNVSLSPPLPVRPTADQVFMEHARSTAKRSTCTRALKYGGIGAVLVVDGREVSQGYAGSMRGDDHCTTHGCTMNEKTGGCDRTVHAELNAVLNAAFHGVRIEGGTCFTTASPCWDCFKALVNAGVKRIVYAEEYRLGVERQKAFAKLHFISFEHVEG